MKIFRKSAEYFDDLPGTWSRIEDRVYIVDPSDHYLPLKNHKILEKGLVQPSVVCPICGFHETVHLAGWP